MPTASAGPPTPADYDAIVAIARSLQRDQASALRLTGRNLALLGPSDSPDAARFEAAGQALGARVARLPHQPDVERPRELRRIGDALGHLYDAVECLGVPPSAVEPLRHAAGIPVFDGISSDAHASAALAERLDPALPLETRRSLILQAILLQTLR